MIIKVLAMGRTPGGETRTSSVKANVRKAQVKCAAPKVKRTAGAKDVPARAACHDH